MRVMDLSARPQSLPVEVDGAVAYELATSLYAIASDEALDTPESGGRWLAALRERAQPGLLEDIRRFDGGDGKIWTFLWSLVRQTAAPQDGAALLAFLERADATELRMRLMADHSSLDDHD